MAKNDYRRSLIMLRGLEKGYSGHARLEKRILTGTMDFIAGAPSADETLSAAFVGKRGGKTYAEAVGLMKNDGRGQRALLASFDPRNIRGMDLSEISAAIISRLDENSAVPVMYGYINGARPLDWQEIQKALDEIYGTDRQKASSAEPVFESAEAPPPIEESYTEPVPAKPVQAENTHSQSGLSAPNAASLLDGVDISKPWPEEIDALRLLFLTMPAYEPFQKDGFVFVKAGMAEETGIDHCAVGVRAENGRIKELCYAIPMPYSATPPAGLEGYQWNGSMQSGWWITCDDVDYDDD